MGANNPVEAILYGYQGSSSRSTPQMLPPNQEYWNGSLLALSYNPARAMRIVHEILAIRPTRIMVSIASEIRQLTARKAKNVVEHTERITAINRLKCLLVILAMGEDQYEGEFVPLFKDSRLLNRRLLPLIGDLIYKGIRDAY